MSLDTGVAVPAVTNVSPADVAVDTDDPGVAALIRYVPVGEYSLLSWWNGMSVCSSYIFR
jgi:hypothetical protein